MSLSFLSADEAVKQLIMSQSSTVEVCEIDQKLTPCRTFGDFWGIIASQKQIQIQLRAILTKY